MPSPSSTPLQVLIPAADTARTAGLPLFLRTAQRVRVEFSEAPLIFCGAESFLSRWKRQTSNLKGTIGDPSILIDPARPLLVVSHKVVVGRGALTRFVRSALESGLPMRCEAGGKTAAVYFHTAGDGLDAAKLAQEALGDKAPERCFAPPSGDWSDGSDPLALAALEKELYDAIPQPTDGFIAKFDRKISMAISSVLVRTPVTPNQITTLSGILGLYGSWLLAFAPYGGQVFGAALLWFCCILDGCDGEVARLKLMQTPYGGLYDVVTDNIVHVALFLAIAVQFQRVHPEAPWRLLGTLTMTGFLGCMFSVWWLVLRVPKSERGEADTFILIERIASRDFIYLVFLLTVLGRLDWFLWAVAFGTHIFYIGLWWALGRKTQELGGRKKAPR